MPNDPFEGFDAGEDPNYAKRSKELIDMFSELVPWGADDKAYQRGVDGLLRKVRAYGAGTPGTYAQVVGAFRWWATQPIGNRTWKERVEKAAERLSIELLERGG